MDKLFLLKNKLQNYGWGSKTAIPELLGQKIPADLPVAELWMGAHPAAPSQAIVAGQSVPLSELIKKNPREILGEQTAIRFANQLPFLFKVLAAELPLSIQAHPDRQQAREGYARENRLRIKPDDYTRTYKDDNHKPEIICAITPFWALNGFLPYTEIISFFSGFDADYLKNELTALAAEPCAGTLQAFYSHLLSLETAVQQRLITAVLKSAAEKQQTDLKSQWLLKMNHYFPNDPGLISAALLNLVYLKPGQGMFLPARQLHAYLQGTGIELMANSDNVLRCGLTPKFVNVPALLQILDFRQRPVVILTPERVRACEQVYRTPAAEFTLSRITITPAQDYRRTCNDTVAIMICLQGTAEVKELQQGKTIGFGKGQAILLAGSLKEYVISGAADIFCARVP